MRAEYDFSNAQPSPWAARLKQPVTLRMDVATLNYFRALADELGMPYQTLINNFLAECARKKLRPEWS
jgi:antitoxin component of RelBE/YafQ-DinJ toxin-antitoxin module